MSFNNAAPAPDLLASEPQKTQTLASTVQPGLEHRPFSDEEIKEAFATFDLDNNRFVGAAEISHILKLIGEDVSHQEIDEMIRMCDSDGDGQVTFDEFYKMMTTPAPPLPPPVNSNKKKPYSDKLGGAKRYAKQLTETGPTFAQKAKEDLSQFKGDWKAQQAAAGGSATDRHHRSVTVEALIHKLSGGMGKIKPSQIKKIYKRFGDIDVDKSGAIDYEEFIQAMDMEDTNIARQMFRVFDMDGSGSIELKEFIVVLSRYTAAAKTEKLKFAFMMFDEDGSGLIDRRELVEMLRASFVVEGFSPEELEERADKIFDHLTLPRDGQIGYDDFLKLASTKNGLIYPVEEERRALGQDKSIDKYLKE